MQADHDVLIDMRWREQGWIDAFRLRLTGWLPLSAAERALNYRVIKRVGSTASCQVALTTKGVELTALRRASMSEDSCRLLADVLRLHDFSSTWMDENAEFQAVILDKSSHFSGPFKDKMVSALQVGATKPADC